MAIEAKLFKTVLTFSTPSNEGVHTCKDCVHFSEGSLTEPNSGYCLAMMHLGAQRRGIDAFWNNAAPDMPYKSAPFVNVNNPCKAFHVNEETGEVTNAWSNVPIEHEES